MFYTKKGDKGTTQLFGKEKRESKASPVFEALGTLDELNTYLGVCRATLTKGDGTIVLTVARKKIPLHTILFSAQEALFIVQAEVAGTKKTIKKNKVTHIERVIHFIEEEIPPIHHFTISGSSPLGARLDYARTLARRAERRVIEVHESGAHRASLHTLAYLNRLSSLLYALARFVEYKEGTSPEAPSYM